MAIITGTARNDVLNGTSGDDTIDGLGGNDTIKTGLGDDIVNGGAGTDTLVIDYSSSTGRIFYFNPTNAAQGFGIINSGGNQVTFSNIENYQITGSAFDDDIFSGDGRDTLDGGAGIDTLFRDMSFFNTSSTVDNTGTVMTLGDGTVARNFENIDITLGAGNDIIKTGLGDDVVDGGAGTDTLVIDYSSSNGRIFYFNPTNAAQGFGIINSGGNQVNFSNIENYQITGSAFDDDIFSGDGRDILDGGAGIDTLFRDMSFFNTSSTVDNTGTVMTLGDGTVARNFENIDITLGAGNDIIKTGLGDDVVDGGAGTDTLVIDYSSSNGRIFYFNPTNAAQGLGIINSGGNQVNFSNIENYQITGSAFDDDIFSGDGRDILDGGAGIDTLFRDMSFFNTSSTVDNTGTVMTLGDGTVARNFENIDITLGAGNDIIKTGLGDDVVDGGAGTDTLVIDYSSSTGRIFYFNPTNAAQGLGIINSGGNQVNFSNIENYQITGSAFDDDIFSGDGRDILDGGAGIDTLFRDMSFFNTSSTVDNTGTVMTLGDGTVARNFENIDITLGAGNDIIKTGLGDDVVDGGAGTDTLVIDYSSSNGRIFYFNPTDTAQGFGIINSSNNQVNFSNIENYQITGSAFDDDIRGGNFNDILIGGAGDDEINAGGGNDDINGGAGTDTLIGGSGNDTYTVDSTNDVITELAGGGIDTVKIATSYTLGANVEYLTLLGSATNGTGNALSNYIIGNSANNILQGLDGNDTFTGGAGNDTFDGGNGRDRVLEIGNFNFTLTNTRLTGNGTDTLISIELASLTGGTSNNTLNASAFTLGAVALYGGAGNDTLLGGAGNDVLDGGAGNDVLDGGAGTDTLIGGSGNDTYIVDSTSDVVTELAAGGTDTVRGFASYTLAAEIENLTLLGSNAINGTGNAINNYLIGNSANNVLLGLNGADTFTGGAGNDTLTGGAGIDLVVESGNFNFILTNNSLTGNGTDTLTSIERVSLTGGSSNNTLNAAAFTFGAVTLRGGVGDDILLGGSKGDVLVGGGGNDLLTGAGSGNGLNTIDSFVGNSGSDRFILSNNTTVFYNDGNNSLAGLADYALIRDFNSAQDQIQLEGAASRYILGSSPIADISGTGIYLDTNNNGVFNSTDELIAIAQDATGLNLTASYFVYS